ncbi:Wadjet anti-phage system protein JetA family protein [Hahella sp. SMD15-11]|uniref:Wadjet anti-phage system protein JetA family protein n=1 Tax=Thermohahella caldifontis TaxID=3142973 RepID=A0AB39V0J0_9GAMM
MFFEGPRQQFFRPLTSKYRAWTAACLALLYRQLYSDMAEYGHALSREQILGIFQEAITRLPAANAALPDGEDDERPLRTEREQAVWVFNQLRECGWLEEVVDEATLDVRFRFTRAGRHFTQPFVELEGGSLRTRQRNTRNTRNALDAFLQHGEIHDLLDAHEYSERIINDFTDVIAELEDRRRTLIREVSADQDRRLAGEAFFEFMEKRFQPDISIRLSADSVEKYRDEILALIDRIRAQPKAFKADAERRLRDLLPDQVRKGQSLLWQILDRIERRLNHATDTMLPALRDALRQFTRRADLIIRQMSYVASQRHTDLVAVCERLRAKPATEQDTLLTRMGERMGGVSIGLVDPARVRLRERRPPPPVNTRLEHLPEVDDSALRAVSLRMALDKAFTITDAHIRDYILSALDTRDRIDTDELPVRTAADLLALTHCVELGSANARHDGWQFRVIPSGRRTQRPGLTETDHFVIEAVHPDDVA